MKFFIGYDNEGFEEAKKASIIPGNDLEGCIQYALHDLNKGFVDSFQVYNQDGVEVFTLANEREAA